ncbi:hypothetical protein [Streptomyces katsurahamanus]|uniref:Uncharacterized protein n=1 Tax=Streptomyces katsurahamanus TaxID=2577098 RepID=A0ABW9NSC1_9ACTN|nr:hypothetical protein [Streptomyces katsurahamanus]MQS36195.1 hypothetical protein [Streptomyces katsurahamanus]
MAAVTPDGYVSQVIDRAAGLVAPDGPRRRAAPEDRFAESFSLIRDSVAWLAQSRRARSIDESLSQAYEISLEITSSLYAAGADGHAWRSWSSLASWGYALRGDVSGAVPYAVLGGSWGHLEGLQAAPHRPPLPERVVRNLALGAEAPLSGPENSSEAPLPGPESDDDIDRAWLRLAVSIPRKDHRRTEESLQTLADFWILEDEEWDVFALRGYPCFDPCVCAAAALARRDGYRPRELTHDARRFLDPGLAP